MIYRTVSLPIILHMWTLKVIIVGSGLFENKGITRNLATLSHTLGLRCWFSVFRRAMRVIISERHSQIDYTQRVTSFTIGLLC